MFNKKLLEIVKNNFKLDFYGAHGIYHWQRVYKNTQILSTHYKINSPVFELFSLFHDSKRENEYSDIYHGFRASEFVKELLEKKEIILNENDTNRLLYAIANHTISDENNPLFNDLIVQICFDSDRLDLGRVGIEPEEKYMITEFGKKLVREKKFYWEEEV